MNPTSLFPRLRPYRWALAFTAAALVNGPAAAQSNPSLSLPFGTNAFVVQTAVPPTKVDTFALPLTGISPPVQASGEPRDLTGLRQLWGTQLVWTPRPDGSPANSFATALTRSPMRSPLGR